jgi:S1-C subfamily serine protease
VEVGYVFKNGPADKCGLKSGDIIKEVDGKKIYSLYDLKVILEEKEPGDVIRLKVKREIIPAPGEEPTVEILQMELKLGKPLKREPPPVVRPKEEKPEEKPEDIW